MDSSRHAVGSEATGPNSCRLVAQHGQVGDRLTAVGEHHRHIDRDPARVMPDRAAAAAPASASLNAAGQAGHLGDIGQQPGTGMTDHTPPISH